MHLHKGLCRVFFHGYFFTMASVKFRIISCKIISKWYFCYGMLASILVVSLVSVCLFSASAYTTFIRLTWLLDRIYNLRIQSSLNNPNSCGLTIHSLTCKYMVQSLCKNNSITPFFKSTKKCALFSLKLISHSL